MSASPSPAPSQPTSGFDASTVLHSVAHGFATAINNSPWLGALLAFVIIMAAVGFVRGLIHGGHPKDAVRRFTTADRRIIFERAGHRNEHYFPIFGRCRATTGLQADHVHPHSRGGWTSINNGQALCSLHNREKSARVPWDWQLAGLAKRRADYFGFDHDPLVVRHRPKTPRPKPSPNAMLPPPRHRSKR